MMHHVPSETVTHDEEISLRDYWRVLVHYRRFIGTVASLIVLLMALWTLQQSNIYRSAATLIPLSGSPSGLSAALSQLGGFVPALGGALSKDNPTDRLLAVLQSYTLALGVVQHLHLRPLLYEEQWNARSQQWQTPNPPTEQDAVRTLQGLVSITSSRQGVITIAVEHPDPVLAAAIANRYVSSLQQSLQNNAFSLAKKQRLFIAEQLGKARQDLAVAEEALKHFEQTYGIVALDAQTTAAVQAIAFLEGQIMIKEVQLGVQQRLTTGASQEVTLLQEELQGLRHQLSRLQRGLPEQQSTSVKPSVEQAWLPFHEAPDIKLRYARLQRESLVQNKVYALLAQQLEQAKIDEARDDIAFQVLDHALPPDRKSKPKRLQHIVLAGVAGLFLGVVLAFVRQAMDNTVRSPEQVEQLLGLPVLATLPVPVLLASPWGEHAPLPLSHRVGQRLPGAAMMSTLQYLYTRLKYLDNAPPVQTVLMIGPEATESCEALVSHFAAAVASAGDKILVIDANLQHPILHQRFRCAPTPGLAEALADPSQWAHSIQKTQVENMHFVAAGAGASTTLANLASTHFDRLLEHYKAVYGLILCAASTSSELHEALILGKKTDITCFVLLEGISGREAMLTTKHALEAIQAHIAGAIFLEAAS